MLTSLLSLWERDAREPFGTRHFCRTAPRGRLWPPFEHPEGESVAGRREIGDRPVIRVDVSFRCQHPGGHGTGTILMTFRGSVPTDLFQTIASCESLRNGREIFVAPGLTEA